MTTPDVEAAVERPDWPVTEHGVATYDEVETAIVRVAADDAVLAYRLQGFVATILASHAALVERPAVSVEEVARVIVEGIPVPTRLANEGTINAAATRIIELFRKA